MLSLRSLVVVLHLGLALGFRGSFNVGLATEGYEMTTNRSMEIGRPAVSQDNGYERFMKQGANTGLSLAAGTATSPVTDGVGVSDYADFAVGAYTNIKKIVPGMQDLGWKVSASQEETINGAAELCSAAGSFLMTISALAGPTPVGMLGAGLGGLLTVVGSIVPAFITAPVKPTVEEVVNEGFERMNTKLEVLEKKLDDIHDKLNKRLDEVMNAIGDLQRKSLKALFQDEDLWMLRGKQAFETIFFKHETVDVNTLNQLGDGFMTFGDKASMETGVSQAFDVGGDALAALRLNQILEGRFLICAVLIFHHTIHLSYTSVVRYQKDAAKLLVDSSALIKKRGLAQWVTMDEVELVKFAEGWQRKGQVNVRNDSAYNFEHFASSTAEDFKKKNICEDPLYAKLAEWGHPQINKWFVDQLIKCLGVDSLKYHCKIGTPDGKGAAVVAEQKPGIDACAANCANSTECYRFRVEYTDATYASWKCMPLKDKEMQRTSTLHVSCDEFPDANTFSISAEPATVRPKSTYFLDHLWALHTAGPLFAARTLPIFRSAVQDGHSWCLTAAHEVAILGMREIAAFALGQLGPQAVSAVWDLVDLVGGTETCKERSRDGLVWWPSPQYYYEYQRYDELTTDPKGFDYRGQVSQTKTGKICKNWLKVGDNNNRNYYPPYEYPDFGTGDHNYCRNSPSSAAHAGPWCYYGNGNGGWFDFGAWELCSIPQEKPKWMALQQASNGLPRCGKNVVVRRGVIQPDVDESCEWLSVLASQALAKICMGDNVCPKDLKDRGFLPGKAGQGRTAKIPDECSLEFKDTWDARFEKRYGKLLPGDFVRLRANDIYMAVKDEAVTTVEVASVTPSTDLDGQTIFKVVPSQEKPYGQIALFNQLSGRYVQMQELPTCTFNSSARNNWYPGCWDTTSRRFVEQGCAAAQSRSEELHVCGLLSGKTMVASSQPTFFKEDERADGKITLYSMENKRFITMSVSDAMDERLGGVFSSARRESFHLPDGLWWERFDVEVVKTPDPMYLGCFEFSHAQIVLKDSKGPTSTIDQCATACAGYKYFARQGVGQCWCTDDYKSPKRQRDCRCGARVDQDIGEHRQCIYELASAKGCKVKHYQLLVDRTKDEPMPLFKDTPREFVLPPTTTTTTTTSTMAMMTSTSITPASTESTPNKSPLQQKSSSAGGAGIAAAGAVGVALLLA